MAKETCTDCNAKLPGRVSFCPDCSRPTRHASNAEMIEWDLGQWRRHRDRSAAEVSGGTSVAVRTMVITPHPDLEIIRRPAGAAKTPSGRRARLKLRLAMPSIKREPADRVIVLDSDNPFAYTACTVCERDDWILRTGRNEDRTYNYWCVRCSRSFKTEVRLPHAMKPFLAAGSVVGVIAAFSFVLS